MSFKERDMAGPAAGPRATLVDRRVLQVIAAVAVAGAMLVGVNMHDRAVRREWREKMEATFEPTLKLEVAWKPEPGVTMWVTCWNLLPNAPAWVVCGASTDDLPLGDWILVPHPDLIFQGKAASYGTLGVPLPIPKAGLPDEGWVQVWSHASGSWQGSNAVHLVFPAAP